MKNLLITILAIFIAHLSVGQILSNSVLNLNPGGVIHDVVYDSYYDAYVVVGSFTSIDGQARNNLAFIDANTMQVMPQAPITSIDGEIRTVEIVNNLTVFHVSLGIGSRQNLFIGGNFTSINGSTGDVHVNVARLSATHYFGSPPVGGLANYAVNNWDLGIFNQFVASFGVNDMQLSNDTLVMVGEFIVDDAVTGFNDLAYNVIAVDPTNNAGTPVFRDMFFPSPAVGGASPIAMFGIQRFNDQYYLHGKDAGGGDYHVRPYSLNGVMSTSVNYNLELNGGDAWDMEIVTSDSDTIVFIAYAAQAAATGLTDVFYIGGSNANLINGGYSAEDLTSYKQYVFASDQTQDNLSTHESQGGYNVVTTNTIPLNSNWTGTSLPNNQLTYHRTHVEKNLLFLSGENLTTVGGQPRTGLAIFCLEPMDAGDFIVFDNTVCEGETETFSIPATEFVAGYRWSYTGSGAEYRVSGTLDALQPLTTVDIVNQSANSLDIYFPVGTSNGQLLVEPFDTCNTSGDIMYSAGKSLNITVNAIPDISIADSTFLTCYSDTAILTLSTVTSGTVDSLFYNNTWTQTDSIVLDYNMSVIVDGEVYGIVTDPVSGCQAMDTTYFMLDRTAPSAPTISTNPAEFTCSTDSMVVTAVSPGATLTWVNDLDTLTILPNPMTVYDTDSNSYTVTSLDVSNGCSSELSGYSIPVNTVMITPELIGYPSISIPADTVSCANSSLVLECSGSPATDGTFSWLNGGVPTGSAILNLSAADSAGMDPVTQTKIFEFETVHTGSGCTNVTGVVIYFDFEAPFVFNHSGNESINCSQDSAVVVHAQTTGGVIEGWLDQFGVQTGSDTLIAYTTGDYYYQVESTVNGCIATDTFTVAQTLDMNIDLSADTLICPNQTVEVTATPIINTGETPTYLWSTGSTYDTTFVTGGVDSQASVVIQTPSGCIGYDTISVSITPPVVVDISSSAGCTEAVLQIDNVSGGSGNYQFSIDGTNWQTSPAFTGLAPSTYDVFVQDDLGCIYGFIETIDPNAGGLDVNFLVSTYNEEGDTIALVNISSFSGFDSLEWIAPPGAIITSEDDSMLVLSIDTEGWYDVTLIGYLDTCQYSFTKPVYFGTDAPVFNENASTYGIQYLNVYPNPVNAGLIVTVDVEFGVSQNYSIIVTSTAGQPVPSTSTSGTGQVVQHQFEFPVGTNSGAYVIHIVGDFDAEQSTIIVN